MEMYSTPKYFNVISKQGFRSKVYGQSLSMQIVIGADDASQMIKKGSSKNNPFGFVLDHAFVSPVSRQVFEEFCEMGAFLGLFPIQHPTAAANTHAQMHIVKSWIVDHKLGQTRRVIENVCTQRIT